MKRKKREKRWRRKKTTTKMRGREWGETQEDFG